MHGRLARRGLWIVTAAAWAAAVTLWHYGLHDRHAADLLAVTASLASVCVGAGLWRRIRRAEQSVLTTWFESPALVRRVSELEQQCACYEAKNAELFQMMAMAAGVPPPDPRPDLRVVRSRDAG